MTPEERARSYAQEAVKRAVTTEPSTITMWSVRVGESHVFEIPSIVRAATMSVLQDELKKLLISAYLDGYRSSQN